MSRRLLLLCVLASLGAAITEASTLRTERQAEDCEEATTGFDECTNAAYDEYKAAYEAGDDGKPDWMARKACNYMTAAVEECGDELVGECYSEEDVIAMKDHQLKNVLEVLEKSVEEWDTEKCPAVMAHVERVKGSEDNEDDEDNDGIPDEDDNDDDNDGIPDEEDDDDDNDGIPDTEEDGDEGEDEEDDEDFDDDGIINAEDTDDDNDGIPDEEDVDDDNDGVNDSEDDDDDNDGVPDSEEEEDSEDDSSESSANAAGLSLALVAIVLGRFA